MPTNARWKVAGQALGLFLVALLPASYGGYVVLVNVRPGPTDSIIGAWLLVSCVSSAVGSMLIALCAFRWRAVALTGAAGGAGGLGVFLLLCLVGPKGSADQGLALAPLICGLAIIVFLGLGASFAAGLASLIKGYPRNEGRCVSCGYDLRGLPEPRCPECGTPFDPASAVNKARERSDSP